MVLFNSTIVSMKEIQKKILDALTTEPQTPNEIAIALKMNQKTAQSALLELANTYDNVRWKKIGPYRIFWKSDSKEKKRLENAKK